MRIFSALFLAALLVCSIAPCDDMDEEYADENHFFVTGQKRYVHARRSNGTYHKTDFTPSAMAVGYRFNGDNIAATLAVSNETGSSRNYSSLSVEDAGLDRYRKIHERTLGITASVMMTGEDNGYASGTIFAGYSKHKLHEGYDLHSIGGGVTGLDSYRSRGSRGSLRVGAGMEAGERYDLGNGLGIIAHLGFDYAHLPTERIPRSGTGGNDSFSFPNQSIYEFPLGVGIAKEMWAGDWTVTPNLDCTLITTVGHIRHANRNARAGFSAYGTQGWKTYGVGAGHLGGRVSTGLKIAKYGTFDLDIKYLLESRKSYREHQINAGIGVSF